MDTDQGGVYHDGDELSPACKKIRRCINDVVQTGPKREMETGKRNILEHSEDRGGSAYAGGCN